MDFILLIFLFLSLIFNFGFYKICKDLKIKVLEYERNRQSDDTDID